MKTWTILIVLGIVAIIAATGMIAHARGRERRPEPDYGDRYVVPEHAYTLPISLTDTILQGVPAPSREELLRYGPSERTWLWSVVKNLIGLTPTVDEHSDALDALEKGAAEMQKTVEEQAKTIEALEKRLSELEKVEVVDPND